MRPEPVVHLAHDALALVGEHTGALDGLQALVAPGELLALRLDARFEVGDQRRALPERAGEASQERPAHAEEDQRSGVGQEVVVRRACETEEDEPIVGRAADDGEPEHGDNTTSSRPRARGSKRTTRLTAYAPTNSASVIQTRRRRAATASRAGS